VDEKAKEKEENAVSSMTLTTKLILGAALGVAGAITGINTYQTTQPTESDRKEEAYVKEREKLENRILNHIKLVREGIEKEDTHLRNSQQDLSNHISQLHKEYVDIRSSVSELQTACRLGQQVDATLLERCEDCKQRILEHERKKHTHTGGLEYDIYSGAIFNRLTGASSK